MFNTYLNGYRHDACTNLSNMVHPYLNAYSDKYCSNQTSVCSAASGSDNTRCCDYINNTCEFDITSHAYNNSAAFSSDEFK